MSNEARDKAAEKYAGSGGRFTAGVLDNRYDDSKRDFSAGWNARDEEVAALQTEVMIRDQAVVIERDRWREMAGKLAFALDRCKWNSKIQSITFNQENIEKVLAEFEAMKKECGE